MEITREMIGLAVLADMANREKAPETAMRAVIAAVTPAILEAAAAAGERAWPRAHTYASENADLYRGQDHAAAKVVRAVRDLARGLK